MDRTITSLDGVAISTGIGRFFQTDLDWAPTYTLGIDFESADTDGADLRYRAYHLHGNVTLQLGDRWQLLPSAGIGHRDDYDFTGSVNRDELTWRVGAKLRRQLTEKMAIMLVAGHDRFASDNEDFDLERTQGGVVLSVNY